MKVFFCPFLAVEETAVSNGTKLKVEGVLFPLIPDCVSFFFPVRSLCVILVFSTKGQRYLRVGLAVPLFGSVACLRRMVADEGKLSPDQVT